MIDMPETYTFLRNLNVAGAREVPPGGYGTPKEAEKNCV